jgi:hypothetical protein
MHFGSLTIWDDYKQRNFVRTVFVKYSEPPFLKNDLWCQSYSSAVKVYNATSSLVRFGNKLFSSSYFETLYVSLHADLAVVNSEVVGLAPGWVLKTASG